MINRWNSLSTPEGPPIYRLAYRAYISFIVSEFVCFRVQQIQLNQQFTMNFVFCFRNGNPFLITEKKHPYLVFLGSGQLSNRIGH